MQNHNITIKITGYTPLLMHNPQGMQPGGGAKTRRIPSAEEEARAGAFADENDYLYLKFISFRNCCLKGARNFKVGKMAATQFLGGCILNVDLDAPCYLEHPETGKRLTVKDYEIDLRRAVVQKNGVLRARPKIQRWQTIITFEMDVSQVTKPEDLDNMVVDCLRRGGQFVGIGDYRPEKGGPFGRFTAELVVTGRMPASKR